MVSRCRVEMPSEIEQLRAELARANEAIQQRDNMLAIVAHELRNPLGPVLMSLDVLELELADDSIDRAALARRIQQTRRYTERLRSDLDRLLDFSRLRSGRIDLRFEELDLSAVVAEELRTLRPLLAASQCTVRLSLDTPQPGHWDRMRLGQVIWNLVSNAAKYAAGSLVEISTTGDETSARFIVRDHGPGIPEAERDAAFRRFERLQTTAHTGFGVGLWLVKQIVEAMGGTIDLDTEVGFGTTFAVTLPRSKE